MAPGVLGPRISVTGTASLVVLRAGVVAPGLPLAGAPAAAYRRTVVRGE